MERMSGIPIGRVDELVRAGIDLKRLARAGVEIFFTQVFRDGYFHADMHPGNTFVANDPVNFGKYIALDFGIMGTLSERDKSYLAQNFLAFFRRDYHRVATAHIESGWVPPDTRVDELESEIRVVCEPIFDRPLKEISLAKVLVQLFKASRRFNVEIQTQLVLLQKRLLAPPLASDTALKELAAAQRGRNRWLAIVALLLAVVVVLLARQMVP